MAAGKGKRLNDSCQFLAVSGQLVQKRFGLWFTLKVVFECSLWLRAACLNIRAVPSLVQVSNCP
ncbi:MAG: hypothetical protein ACI9DO_000723 [Reinekea sp.]|jgi:hypothetical protein